jgi:hypothetical protein
VTWLTDVRRIDTLLTASCKVLPVPACVGTYDPYGC